MSEKIERPVIDWTQAPPWARHVGMDSGGWWWWFEHDPVASLIAEGWQHIGRRQFAFDDAPPDGSGILLYWFESIQDRPKEEPTHE